jgi:hypothetical protein
MERIFIQGAHSDAEAAVLSIALGPAAVNRAKSATTRRRQPAGPNGSIPILEKRDNISPSELRKLGQFAVLPTCQSFICSNPKTPVASTEQAQNVTAGEMFPAGGCHGTARTSSKRSKPNSVPSQR